MTDETTSIRAALAAATCTLLGTSAAEPVQAAEEPTWDFNTALLYYGEDEDRVQDLSLNVLARRNFVDDRYLTAGLTIDALTGASPNGALPQSVAQTFTQPSGRRTYTVPAGEIPKDDTFRDTRVALSTNWQQPVGRLYALNIGASASSEYDYLHTGLNARLSRDFNERNTTLSAGLAFSHDTLDPVGGTPAGLAPMKLATRGDDDDGNGGGGDGDETKDVFDIVLGVTQVVSRNLLVQANYSYSKSSGYLNDPYKVLSVVDGATGDAIPIAADPVFDGPSHLFRYELRPDERVKHSLYAQGKYYMDGKVLDISYRYMTDDWEIDSHTVDFRYRWPIGERAYLEPHLRFYTQTQAEFYVPSLVDGTPLPDFASADYRLADFDATTIGLKYGWKTRAGHDVSTRLELYQQSGNIPRGSLIGNQLDRENYPDLKAIIFQFSYRFGL
jgi:opacity protein-like surface antigen